MATSFSRVSKSRPSWLSGTTIAIVATLLLVLMTAGCVTSVVEAGQRGVKYSSISGTDLTVVYGEGLQFVWPWERMVEYEVRVQNRDERISVLSSNGATIGMDVSVRFRPQMRRLPQLHTTYGSEYYERLVQPVVRSVAREVVGQFTPEELYSTRREELQTEIQDQVNVEIGDQYVALQDVLIRDVELPDQVRQAIELKLQEEQRAEQVQFAIDRERREAERKRIEAEGQATYQRLITQSLSPQYLQYEGVRATQALAESDNAKVIVIGGSDGLPIILGDR